MEKCFHNVAPSLIKQLEIPPPLREISFPWKSSQSSLLAWTRERASHRHWVGFFSRFNVWTWTRIHFKIKMASRYQVIISFVALSQWLESESIRCTKLSGLKMKRAHIWSFMEPDFRSTQSTSTGLAQVLVEGRWGSGSIASYIKQSSRLRKTGWGRDLEIQSKVDSLLVRNSNGPDGLKVLIVKLQSRTRS